MASFTLTNVAAVPEPSEVALLGCGLAALALFAWRRRFVPSFAPSALA
jgi:hypothetical protein